MELSSTRRDGNVPNAPNRDVPDGKEASSQAAEADPQCARQRIWSATVILIGTSQNGKSTFINRLRSMAIGPHPLPDLAGVGEGTFSCTKDPCLYEFYLPMTDYVLAEGSSHDIISLHEDNMEHSFFDLKFWKREDLQVLPRTDGANVESIAHLRILDTPGLDDSSESGTADAENIQKVLQTLNGYASLPEYDKRCVSAVIFVVKAGTAFTDSLQKWYHYYQRCMPNLFGSIAVVNTNFRFRDWKKEYAEKMFSFVPGIAKISSRNRRIKQRREAWSDVFKNDPRHFFIDSKPNAKSPVEEFMSRNEVYDILNYLRSQGKLPIDNIHLVKLPHMAAIDMRMANLLRSIYTRWEGQYKQLSLPQSVGEKSLAENKRTQLQHESKVSKLKSQLNEWDSDVQFDLNTYSPGDAITMPAQVWKFCTFRGHENSFEIKENVFPFDVTAPDTEHVTWVSTWKALKVDRTWKGTYKANWRMKVPKFTARSWATNRTVHAAKIAKARRKLDELELEIERLKELIAEANDSLSTIGNQGEPFVRLQNLMERAKDYIRQLEEEQVPLTVGFGGSATARYGKKLEEIGFADLGDMVRERDPELRAALEYESFR